MQDQQCTTIRVATLTEVAVLEMSTMPARQPGPGEVSVAVDACGICGSDLHMFRGHHPILRPPLILGHEFVGRVVAAAPDVRDLVVGDRVVAVAGRGCGTCAACLEGQFNRCEDLKVIGGHLPGGLEDRVTLPADQFVKVPERFSVESASLVEVAAVALHTVNRCGPVAGKSCLVLGCGPVGLVLIRVLRALGAHYIAATDISTTRRALADTCGADLVVDGLHPDEALLEARPQRFDLAYDCVGRQETLLQALRLTRRGATIGLTAIFPAEITIPMVQLQRAERSLIGVQMYHRADFDIVIQLMEEGKLSLDGIVTHTFPLEQVALAFELLTSSNSAAGKVLVRLSN